MATSTPWGPSQHQKKIAPGITSFSTARHGGIRLSKSRNATLLSMFPNFTTYAGGAWYEEDCDVVAVVLAFPDAFDDATIRAAIQSAHSMAENSYGDNWTRISRWLSTPEAAPLNERMANFERENGDKWEHGSMGSCEAGWRVSFTRVRDGANKMVTMAEYPRQRFYTDEELDAATVAA